ncbi:unnamed protein product [Leptosia nina]|uniref:Protein aurora borealis n=1 Tax=Leptosia nina TaxID=320188 RepID=A0AAV1K045_9NEOP
MSENKNEEASTSNNKFTPKKKIRNPFDKMLVERLHQPLSSPGMCKIYKNKTKGPFNWDIEHASTLVPADIIVCNSQYEASPDPILEKIAEEASEKFFSQELVVPSPMESSKKPSKALTAKSSSDSSLQECSLLKKIKFVRNTSAQTTLTLPPVLPPELEKMLQPFCTYSQEEAIFDDCEITANGSIRVQTHFIHSDHSDHYDSEQTDDEIQVEKRSPSSFGEHIPVQFSPDLSNNLVSKGMKRTFGTPVQNNQSQKPLKNKILNLADYEPCLSPIQFDTPKKKEGFCAMSPLVVAVSPVKSSDEEKMNYATPDSKMATCLDCVNSQPNRGKSGVCFCDTTPNKSILRRSTSLKDSPYKSMKSSLSGKRSLSMSSLNRSKSVQKLDFSMDMSVDGSFHNISQGSEANTPERKHVTWSVVEQNKQLPNLDSFRESRDIQSSTRINVNLFDETPIKGKRRTNVAHEISKIRDSSALSPLNMSLDNSLDNFDIPLSMEEKKIDFNTVNLKFLTESVSERSDVTITGECSSFKRVDSGFNEFYASSYYESAIKPSELTISNSKGKALKEISNVNWMRVDSGFKDETSSDSQFYPNESKQVGFSNKDKENICIDNDIIPAPRRNDTMSISDYFNEDLTFTCNFSSTPSKSKRKIPSDGF